LIVSDSTHGRVVSASLTCAGHVAQVMPGTLMTTWFGPVVAIGSSEPRGGGTHPAIASPITTAAVTCGACHFRIA
jgi:hypothetical protein